MIIADLTRRRFDDWRFGPGTERATHRPMNAPWTALVVAALGAVAVPAAAGVPAEAAAAPRVSGIVRIEAGSFGSQSPQTVTAECPEDKQILGGGGVVYGHPNDTLKLTLTRLEPVDSVNGTDRHGFVVTGAETARVDTPWSISAYAICADAVPGHHIEDEPTPMSNSEGKSVAAVCPSGTRVLGSGARIDNPGDHEVGLQVARASASGDIVRAQAHVDASGYDRSWGLTAYAVCATTPEGYQIRYGESDQSESETTKPARVSCGSGRRLIAAGAAITNTAPGHVSLQRSVPYSTPTYNSVSAMAVENTPYNDNWDFIVAQAICVTPGPT